MKPNFLLDNFKISIFDNYESITPGSMIQAYYLKNLSKIFLFITNVGILYYWDKTETLKIHYGNKNNKSQSCKDGCTHYFDIELDSESNQLLENTHFKIKVNE